MHDGIYLNGNGEEYTFSAGNIPEDPDDVCLLRDLENLEYFKATNRFGEMKLTTDLHNEEEDGNTVTDLERLMRSLDLDNNEESDGEDDLVAQSRKASLGNDANWAPHGSKVMFMLDLLDNLPQLCLSDDHLKTIIWVMCECRTPNVPMFSALHRLQAKLTKEVNVEPEHHTSSLGNHFYMNYPINLLALDWANPLVHDHIQVYPEICNIISEPWQADK